MAQHLIALFGFTQDCIGVEVDREEAFQTIAVGVLGRMTSTSPSDTFTNRLRNA